MSHAWEALGWTLIHFCWQAAAIAMLYWLADMAAGKARIQTRYLLSLGGLLLMLAAFLATLGYEAGSRHADPLLWAGAPAAGSLPLMPDGEVATALAKQPAHLHLATLMPWLDLAWLLGVIALSIKTIGGWFWLQRLRRAAFSEAPAALGASFAQACERLGITRSVHLRISDFVSSPLTIGVLRSLILLPASALLALSPEQLEVVPAHELAHVRRADYVWNLVQTAVETIFFFHPAVWWMGRRTRHYRELCCDDIALRSCSDPLVYATALLSMEEQRNRQLNLAMALGGHQPRQALRARIARMLGEALPARSRVRPLPLAMLCAGAALLLLPLPQLVAGATPQSAGPSAALPTAGVAVPGPALSLPKAPDSETRNPTTLNHQPKNQRGRSLGPRPLPDPQPQLSQLTSGASAELQMLNLPQIVHMATSLHLAQLESLQALGELSVLQKAADAASSATPSLDRKDYIDRMRAAGYDVDINKYTAMKIQGITPEYAHAMAAAGLGTPSPDQLIAMKMQGITPEYVSKLHAAGVEPDHISDLIAYRIFHITPEFLEGMRSAGFASLAPKDAIALRVQHVTPEYAEGVKRQFPEVTVQDLIKLRIFHIDDAFIASAKRHGVTPLSVDKLVRLRIFGVLGDDGGEAQKKP